MILVQVADFVPKIAVLPIFKWKNKQYQTYMTNQNMAIGAICVLDVFIIALKKHYSLHGVHLK